MFIVKHVMVALALACFHRVIEFQEYVSTDAAGLLKTAPKRIHLFNRVLDEDFFKYVTNRIYPLEHLSNIQLILLT